MACLPVDVDYIWPTSAFLDAQQWMSITYFFLINGMESLFKKLATYDVRNRRHTWLLKTNPALGTTKDTGSPDLLLAFGLKYLEKLWLPGSQRILYTFQKYLLCIILQVCHLFPVWFFSFTWSLWDCNEGKREKSILYGK